MIEEVFNNNNNNDISSEMNELTKIIAVNGMQLSDIAKHLKLNTKTITRHMKGESPISFEMAKMYAEYFGKHHNIFMDSLTLITMKNDQGEIEPVMHASKIEVTGQFIQSEGIVSFFKPPRKKIIMESKYLTHY